MRRERDSASLAGFEDGGGKGATIQAMRTALEAEDNSPATNHQPPAIKEMETSVLQPHGTRFADNLKEPRSKFCPEPANTP